MNPAADASSSVNVRPSASPLPHSRSLAAGDDCGMTRATPAARRQIVEQWRKSPLSGQEFGERYTSLSITQIICNAVTDVDVGQSRHAAPEDNVARRSTWIKKSPTVCFVHRLPNGEVLDKGGWIVSTPTCIPQKHIASRGRLRHSMRHPLGVRQAEAALRVEAECGDSANSHQDTSSIAIASAAA